MLEWFHASINQSSGPETMEMTAWFFIHRRFNTCEWEAVCGSATLFKHEQWAAEPSAGSEVKPVPPRITSHVAHNRSNSCLSAGGGGCFHTHPHSNSHKIRKFRLGWNICSQYVDQGKELTRYTCSRFQSGFYCAWLWFNSIYLMFLYLW